MSDSPLRVGVGNGEWPVVGASVRFQIVDTGSGTLTPVGQRWILALRLVDAA